MAISIRDAIKDAAILFQKEFIVDIFHHILYIYFYRVVF